MAITRARGSRAGLSTPFFTIDYPLYELRVFQLQVVIVTRSLAITFSLHKLFIEIMINEEKGFD